ncbi:hypothetical protein B0H17DRAFT_1138232 [Mycena rosella]|uniref:Uncharacterized protein n=1 Tax=Mycena rosella TaxID=1033263 RepID=A0AAD7D7I2_MYCRO|nr:hypothetical protein B0H17DRAFT_1138232 [Mycena rosella]
MSNHQLEWIWSRYTTSPDPASSMQSLHRTCSTLIKHVLQPSHIVLAHGGFTLHPDLAVPLADAVTAMDRVLQLAARYHGLPHAPSIGVQELQILTVTTGMHRASQNKIVLVWVTILDCLAAAMREMKNLRLDNELNPFRRTWSSRIPQNILTLPISLRAKLPKNLLESFDIPVVPREVDVPRLCPEVQAPKILSSVCAFPIAGTTAPVQAILREVDVPRPCLKAPARTDTTSAQIAIETPVQLHCVHEPSAVKMGTPELARATAVVLEAIRTHLMGEAMEGAAESMRARDVQRLTKDRSLSSHLRPAVSSPACAHHRDCRPSVKALVAAIEARERMPEQQPTVTDVAVNRLNPRRSVSPAPVTASAVRTIDKARLEGSYCVSVSDQEDRGRPSSAPPTPALTNEGAVELGGLSRSSPALDVSFAAMRTRRLSSMSPAPAVVKNEAVEHGGLRESRQRSGLPFLAIRVSPGSASTGDNHLAIQSPAPALANVTAVKLGGLQRAISDSETHTSENLRGKGSPTPSSSIPAPGLFEDEDQVELGGLDEMGGALAESTSFPQKSKPLTMRKDDGTSSHSTTLKARASRFRVVKGLVLCDPGIRSKSRPRYHAMGVGDIRPLRGILKTCAPAFVKSKIAVELGGLEYSHEPRAIPHLKTRTSDEHSRTSKYDLLVLRGSTLPSSTASPASTLVSDEAAVELGGPLPLQNKRLANAQAASVLTANAHTSFVSQSHSPPVFHLAQATGALVSANMWISWIAYPEHPLFGDVAPDMGWEREGIGTCTAFDLAGTGLTSGSFAWSHMATATCPRRRLASERLEAPDTSYEFSSQDFPLFLSNFQLLLEILGLIHLSETCGLQMEHLQCVAGLIAPHADAAAFTDLPAAFGVIWTGSRAAVHSESEAGTGEEALGDTRQRPQVQTRPEDVQEVDKKIFLFTRPQEPSSRRGAFACRWKDHGLAGVLEGVHWLCFAGSMQQVGFFLPSVRDMAMLTSAKPYRGHHRDRPHEDFCFCLRHAAALPPPHKPSGEVAFGFPLPRDTFLPPQSRGRPIQHHGSQTLRIVHLRSRYHFSCVHKPSGDATFASQCALRCKTSRHVLRIQSQRRRDHVQVSGPVLTAFLSTGR